MAPVTVMTIPKDTPTPSNHRFVRSRFRTPEALSSGWALVRVVTSIGVRGLGALLCRFRFCSRLGRFPPLARRTRCITRLSMNSSSFASRSTSCPLPWGPPVGEVCRPMCYHCRLAGCACRAVASCWVAVGVRCEGCQGQHPFRSVAVVYLELQPSDLVGCVHLIHGFGCRGFGEYPLDFRTLRHRRRPLAAGRMVEGGTRSHAHRVSLIRRPGPSVPSALRVFRPTCPRCMASLCAKVRPARSDPLRRCIFEIACQIRSRRSWHALCA
jgi:hypothetical protein